MHTATELLARQQDLLMRVQGMPTFRRYVGGTVVMDRMQGELDYGQRVDAMEHPLVEWFADHIELLARSAYLFQVTEDMCMVLQHAASTLDGIDQFQSEEAPANCGLVYFERPLPVADVRGRTMLAHWLLWGPTSDGSGTTGTGLYWFNDMFDMADQIVHEMVADMGEQEWHDLTEFIGRWGSIGSEFLIDGTRMGPTTMYPGSDQQARLIAEGITPHSGTNMVRYAKALFFLFNQTLTVTSEPHVRRTVQRAARRMNLPGNVTVIDLRRFEGSRRDGESNIEWAHRWIVRGHTAWRRCSEDHPFAEEYEKGWRCRVYIHAYPKGPEDKPMVVTSKLYRLRR